MQLTVQLFDHAWGQWQADLQTVAAGLPAALSGQMAAGPQLQQLLLHFERWLVLLKVAAGAAKPPLPPRAGGAGASGSACTPSLLQYRVGSPPAAPMTCTHPCLPSLFCNTDHAAAGAVRVPQRCAVPGACAGSQPRGARHAAGPAGVRAAAGRTLWPGACTPLAQRCARPLCRTPLAPRRCCGPPGQSRRRAARRWP